MRTVSEIANEIKSKFIENSIFREVYGIEYNSGDDYVEVFNSNVSLVSLEYIIIYVIAGVIWTHEQIFDTFKADVQKKVESGITGTIPWYHKISLAFQYGDDLIVDEEGGIIYKTIDTTKQIVKRCAVVELGNVLAIKIAKEVSGVPEPLAVDEVNAFSAYMKQRKFAGTKISIYNYPADLINIAATVYYDAQMLSADGKLLDGGSSPVVDAIETYIENIKFGGLLVKNHLIDAIQASVGVCDVVLTEVEVKKYNEDFETINTNAHESYSGYFKTDTISINYLPCNI